MADDEENDPTAPFNELESFDSLWSALKWKQVKKRFPICLRKTLRNRYFFANLVYLAYAIGILFIDYSPLINGETTELTEEDQCNVTMINSTEIDLKEETGFTLANKMYLALAVVHQISATMYWWAWRDHRWNDVIMFPEYLNHIEAALYLWSAVWYIKEEVNDLNGYYTIAIHRIEIVAAFVELFASFGWIMSWYRTYTRTIGRGYTLEDSDTIAFTLTTISSFIYITYNIQINIDPLEYGENFIYYYGDIIYFVGAFFYLWANLRDDGWLWWLPVAGQYGIAPGKIDTGRPIRAGLPHLLIGGYEPCLTPCRTSAKDKKKKKQKNLIDVDTTKAATTNRQERV